MGHLVKIETIINSVFVIIVYQLFYTMQVARKTSIWYKAAIMRHLVRIDL